MYSLMSDPVMLPTSKVVVDRSVVSAHLLSDPCDPFNRQPLKIEDCIELPELKAQIEEWKAAKRRARQEAQ